MKKLILMMLLVVGGVMSASATILHIGLEINYTGNVKVHYYGGTSETIWGSAPAAEYDGVLYGRRWYHIDIHDNTSAIVRFEENNWNDRGRAVTGISGDDCYIYVSSEDTKEWIDGQKVWNTGKLASKGWQTMKFSNDVDNKWDDDAPECTKVDDNTFTYTLTKGQIDAANKTKIFFRYKLANGVFFAADNDYWDDHYFRLGSNDSQDDVAINIAQSITNNSYTTDKQKNWYVSVPTYDYEKLVFTIQDVTSGSSFGNNTWKVTVDAYVSKTISDAGFATFAYPVALNIEGATPSLKAYTGSVSNNKLSLSAVTAVPAGNGVLLKGDAGTYSIPVAASASELTDNEFVGVTEAGTTIAPIIGDKTNLVLMKDGDYVGFYKFEANAFTLGQYTAYLSTYTSNFNVDSSRGFSLNFDETTAIQSLNNQNKTEGIYYNMQGIRVSNPTKGMYIVNGKKVILK